MCGNRTHRTLPYGSVPLVLKTRQITRPNPLPSGIIDEKGLFANPSAHFDITQRFPRDVEFPLQLPQIDLMIFLESHDMEHYGFFQKPFLSEKHVFPDRRILRQSSFCPVVGR